MISYSKLAEEIHSILEAPEYDFEIKQYDEMGNDVLSPKQAHWIYVEPVDFNIRFPKDASTDLSDREVYFWKNRENDPDLMKQIIDRVRKVCNLYGVGLTVKDYAQHQMKKRFSNEVEREREEEQMTESMEEKRIMELAGIWVKEDDQDDAEKFIYAYEAGDDLGEVIMNSDELSQLYNDISAEYGLHGDDDFELIHDRMYDELEDRDQDVPMGETKLSDEEDAALTSPEQMDADLKQARKDAGLEDDDIDECGRIMELSGVEEAAPMAPEKEEGSKIARKGWRDKIKEGKGKPYVSKCDGEWCVIDGDGKEVKNFKKNKKDAMAYLDKNYDKLNEGMEGSRRRSHMTLGETKLVVIHENMLSEEPHSRERSNRFNIESIFVEHAGERYRLAENYLPAGRAMVRHIHEGGKFTDKIGKSICEKATEIASLVEFIKEYRGRAGDSLLEMAYGRTRMLRESIGKFAGPKNYQLMKENFAKAPRIGKGRIDEMVVSLSAELGLMEGEESHRGLPFVAKLQIMEQAERAKDFYQILQDKFADMDYEDEKGKSKRVTLGNAPEHDANLKKLAQQLSSGKLPYKLDAASAKKFAPFQKYDLVKLGNISRKPGYESIVNSLREFADAAMPAMIGDDAGEVLLTILERAIAAVTHGSANYSDRFDEDDMAIANIVKNSLLPVQEKVVVDEELHELTEWVSNFGKELFEMEDKQGVNFSESAHPWDEMNVLHYSDEKSDKIWGYFVEDEYVYAFWGRRGKTYQHKKMPNQQEADKLFWNKQKKGYQDITDHAMAKEIANDAYSSVGVFSESIDTLDVGDTVMHPELGRSEIYDVMINNSKVQYKVKNRKGEKGFYTGSEEGIAEEFEVEGKRHGTRSSSAATTIAKAKSPR